MKRTIDELTDRIKKLYRSYEKFILNGENRNLAIIFQNNKVLTFYLYNNGELIDELSLSFEDKEYAIYTALCVNVFIITLGNVYIHKETEEDKSIYYNNKHKPYQAIISEDRNLNNIFDALITKQDNEFINLETQEVKNIMDSIKPKRYSRKFLDRLDQRIKISCEMLKWR